MTIAGHSAPARVDLRRLFVDVDSFLGRAAAAGVASGILSERFPDVLMAYLRARALAFAQRNRTGIALGREALELGVERAWTCIDLALRDDTSGDLEAAVERLAAGAFQSLYDRGYELVFLRLERLATESRRLLLDERVLAFAPDLVSGLRRWAGVVPETWTSPDGESGEHVKVDPVAEFEDFLQASAELTFIASLPRAAMDAVRREEGRLVQDLPAVMRRVLLALALERDDLTVSTTLVDSFRRTAFAQGRWRESVRNRVLSALDEHLRRLFADAHDRRVVGHAAEQEFDGLETASTDGRRFLMRFREDLVPDDPQRGQDEALKDVRRETGADVLVEPSVDRD